MFGGNWCGDIDSNGTADDTTMSGDDKNESCQFLVNKFHIFYFVIS